VAEGLGPSGHQDRREAENAVLADDAQVVRWVGPAFVLFSAIMVPWTIYLGLSLPMRENSPHYDIAWVGFDVLLLVALASTGYLALRRSPYLAIAAAATATLLVVDAWFDIMTSPRRQLPQAITSALLIELPLAGLCAWLSYHTQHLEEQRIVLLMRRRPAGGGRPSFLSRSARPGR
jgi:hypothetical protein